MRAAHAEAPRRASCLPWPHREKSDVDLEGADSLERILAADLARVFLTSAPEVDLVALGLAIAANGRRREEQGRREWGERAS